MKRFGALVLAAVMLFLYPCVSSAASKRPDAPKPTPKATSNPDARIGLSVKEVGLKKFNRDKGKIGARVKDTVKLSALKKNEIYVPCISVANYQNSSFSGILKLEITGDLSLTVRWDTKGIPRGYQSTYWITQFPREKGTYRCTWYYDDLYLIERTFVIE